MNHSLSKSRVLDYLQCPKRLYLSVNQPELAQESADRQERIEAGKKIGRLTRTMFTDGILIAGDNVDLAAAVELTRLAMRDHPDRPLFEATVKHQGLLVQSDILIPDGDGYRMVEVKSSTEVKDHYLQDSAVQTWALENAGVKVNSVAIMHVDNGFDYGGSGNYRGLLKEVDVTESIQMFVEQVPMWIEDCRHLLKSGMPAVDIGKQCDKPVECPFKGHCGAGQSEYPVHLLPNAAGKRVAELLKAEGYQDLRDVPAGKLENENLERIRRVTVSGVAELDAAAGQAMAALHFPRYYLDFETIQFAIPIWPDTRPYQQLPFQWSCHVETTAGQLEHFEFLDVTGEPPLRRFAESLIETLGGDGPILVYNQAFEKSRIQELAIMFPDLAPQLTSLLDRVVDLLPIARQYYYHPAMKGSWSIKAVLPTIAPDLDYSALDEVQDGGSAQLAYAEAIANETPADRREELRRALSIYCSLDTMAMVRLAQFFAAGGNDENN